MPSGKYRISYVKKPFAKKSLVAIALSAAAVLLCFFGLRLSILGQGNGGPNAAACAFCSLLVSFFAIGYAVQSFLEQDKNYIFSKISLAISGVLTVLWLGLMVAAGKG